MTVWLPDSGGGGHEYDSENPDDAERLIAFMDKISHYTDSDGVLWINKGFPHTDEEDDG